MGRGDPVRPRHRAVYWRCHAEQNSLTFRIRYRSDITASMRIVFRGEITRFADPTSRQNTGARSSIFSRRLSSNGDAKGYGKNISIKVHGVEELQAAIRKLKKSVQFRINQAAVNAAGKVIREAVRISRQRIFTSGAVTSSARFSKQRERAIRPRRGGDGDLHAEERRIPRASARVRSPARVREKQGRSRTTGMFLKPPKFGNRKVKRASSRRGRSSGRRSIRARKSHARLR